MQANVTTLEANTAGSVELNDAIFGLEPRPDILHRMVRYQQLKRMAGTHSSQDRSEVNVTGKKVYRQKGTGGARKGNIRNPLYKGGGTVFGPKPHSYDIKLNRKVKDLAKISALSYKARENAIVVVEDLALSAPKTKEAQNVLKGLKLDKKRTLFVMPEYNESVQLSFRNIPTVLGVLLADVNTYDIVNSDVLLLTENAAKIFSEEEATAEA